MSADNCDGLRFDCALIFASTIACCLQWIAFFSCFFATKEKFGHCFMTIYLEVSSTQRTWKLPQPIKQVLARIIDPWSCL
jgi:hypothetical protein